MARSFFHEPNTAPTAPHICSIGSSGNSLPVASLTAFLKRLTSSLQIVDAELGVELDPLFVLEFLHDLLERVDLGLRCRLEAEHDVAVHLHETAIAVPGEAFVAGLVDQPLQGGFVEADVEDGIHHAGHGDAGAGPAGDEQRVLGVAELGPHGLFGFPHGRLDFALELGGIGVVVGVEVGADFGGQGEAGGDRADRYWSFRRGSPPCRREGSSFRRWPSALPPLKQ